MFTELDTRIRLVVKELIDSQIRSGAYTLVLAEAEGQHRIPIIIGTAEAQSITFALEHLTPPRPITHDLFTNFIRSFNIKLKEVFIYRFDDGIYYSELLFMSGEQLVKLDSRTSDAIAIALRVGCPIFVAPEVLRECGVLFDDSVFYEEKEEEEEVEGLSYDLDPEDIKDEVQLKRWLTILDEEELTAKLNEAVLNENYEYAKLYQDELRRRKPNE